jgi:hypothetical protein
LFTLSHASPKYTSVPLDELNHNAPSKEPRSEHAQLHTSDHNGRVRISVLLITVAALSARIEVFRRISLATECTIGNLTIWLPLLLACYDCVRTQKSIPREPVQKQAGITQSIATGIDRYIIQPRTRYVVCTGAACVGFYLLRDIWRPLNSTYICPISVGQQRSIPLLQVCGIFADLTLAIVAYEMSPKSDGTGLSPRRTTVLWSTTFSVSALIWALVGVCFYVFKPEVRFWLMLVDVPSFFSTVLSIFMQSVLLSAFVVTTIRSVRHETACPLGR